MNDWTVFPTITSIGKLLPFGAMETFALVPIGNYQLFTFHFDELFHRKIKIFLFFLLAIPIHILVCVMSMVRIIICIANLSVVQSPITIWKWIHINYETFIWLCLRKSWISCIGNWQSWKIREFSIKRDIIPNNEVLFKDTVIWFKSNFVSHGLSGFL